MHTAVETAAVLAQIRSAAEVAEPQASSGVVIAAAPSATVASIRSIRPLFAGFSGQSSRRELPF
eukprot:367720-Prymnesium_polylepis.1